MRDLSRRRPFTRRLAVTATFAGLVGGPLAAALVGVTPNAQAETAEPFANRYSDTVYGDFTTIGNTVMGCPTDDAAMAARCATAQQGQGSDNNNQFDMQRIDAAGLPGTFDSSTGELTVPAGAKVTFARLFWGGNNGHYRLGRNELARCDRSGADVAPPPGDPASTQPLVRVGTGTTHQARVTPEDYATTRLGTGGPHYYTAEADVTKLFAAAPTGSPLPIAVGDIWAPSGRGCVGGWSLTLVYDLGRPTAAEPTRRAVDVFGGQVLQRSADPDTDVPVSGFYRAGTQAAHASVTAYEGDRNSPGDQFRVNGTNIPEPHTGATNNFFVSAADGDLTPSDPNNLSVDAKEFAVPGAAIPAGTTSATLTLRTRGDTYVVSQLALSVPVPDLEVTKAVSPTTAHPGDTVTYTISARNISDLDYPGARFSDDLAGDLDDATYNDDATASNGSIAYDGRHLRWTGDVPAGKTATVRYSVTVDDPPAGDRVLRNEVLVESRRLSNCSDQACEVDTPIQTASSTPTPTPTPSPSPSPSPSPTETATPTPTPSPSPTETATPSPTETSSPNPTASPAPNPTSTPSTPAPQPTNHPRPLPRTGASGVPLLGGAALLLAGIGIPLIAVSRRRSRR